MKNGEIEIVDEEKGITMTRTTQAGGARTHLTVNMHPIDTSGLEMKRNASTMLAATTSNTLATILVTITTLTIKINNTMKHCVGQIRRLTSNFFQKRTYKTYLNSSFYFNSEWYTKYYGMMQQAQLHQQQGQQQFSVSEDIGGFTGYNSSNDKDR